MRQRVLSLLARVAITIALLAFVFSRVDAAQVLADMRRAQPPLVALAVLFFVLAMLTNALKWGVLLRAQNVPVGWGAIVRYTFVGFFFNNFLPAGVGGDLMRGYGLARDTRRRADAAVSIVVDRLVGLITLAGMAVLAVLYARTTGSTGLDGPFWGALVTAAFLTAFLALMVSRRIRQSVGWLVHAVAGRLPFLRPLVPIYDHLADAIGAYRHQPGAILLAIAVGSMTWIFSNLTNYALSLSLPVPPGGGAPIGLLDIFIYNPIVGLTQTLPISIGGLGANQTVYDLLYHVQAGYDAQHVAATSLLMQAVIYLSSMPGGLIWWFDRGKGEGEES